MQYNDDNFGEIPRSALTKSPYFEHYEEGKPVPPPSDFYLLDDSGIDLVDDTSDYLVTP